MPAVMMLVSLLEVKNKNSEVAIYEMILICLKTGYLIQLYIGKMTDAAVIS